MPSRDAMGSVADDEGSGALTRARIAGHPVHPVLVGIPIGLCTFSLFADIIRLTGLGKLVWFDLALYAIAGGIVAALVAAIPGLVDYLTVTDSRVRDLVFAHVIAALFVVAVFGWSLWERLEGNHGLGPVAISVVGVLLLGVVGWLGVEMVFVHGIDMDAPAAPPRARRKVA
jgi:uncharacterized membrane protein